MKVVATAPIPGRSTPSFPVAGAIVRPFPVVVMDGPPAGLLLETRKLGV
jgi:hypothetical protein